MSKNPPLLTQYVVKGFTLAELLIALGILAVIATFTIPKILQSQQDQKYNAVAKETMAMISQAFQKYQLEGLLRPSSKASDLTPYMNYMAIDTSGTVDNFYSATPATATCSSAQPCLKLHNGAKLFMDNQTFGAGATTNITFFLLDPDGVTDGTTNGPGKSFKFGIYYDGFITTRNNVRVGTMDGVGNSYPPCSSCDPSWLSWN